MHSHFHSGIQSKKKVKNKLFSKREDNCPLNSEREQFETASKSSELDTEKGQLYTVPQERADIQDYV